VVSNRLGGFFDRTGTDALRADFNPFDGSRFIINTSQLLKIRTPDGFALIVGVTDIIAYLRLFSTYVTNTRHGLTPLKKM